MREDDLLGLEFWRKQRAMGVRGVTTAAKGGGMSWSSYWATRGVTPGADATLITTEINAALQTYSVVKITEAGIYDIDGTIYIPSNTTLEFVAGCTLRKETGSSFYHMIANENIQTLTADTNVSLIGNGLNCDINSIDNAGSIIRYGLRGQLMFYQVSGLTITGVETESIGEQQFFIHVAEVSDVVMRNIDAEGWKDAIHFGVADNVLLEDIRTATGDDGIALNAGDYYVSNPTVGNITNVTIRRWTDDYYEGQGGSGCLLLSRSWESWTNGHDYLLNDYVVNEGNIYQKITVGEDTASDAPTHTSGIVEGADGISWIWLQAETINHADVVGVNFEDCIWQSDRHMIRTGGSAVGGTMRSFYPGTGSQSIIDEIVIDNVTPLPVGSTDYIISVDVNIGSIEFLNCAFEVDGFANGLIIPREETFIIDEIIFNNCQMDLVGDKRIFTLSALTYDYKVNTIKIIGGSDVRTDDSTRASIIPFVAADVVGAMVLEDTEFHHLSELMVISLLDSVSLSITATRCVFDEACARLVWLAGVTNSTVNFTATNCEFEETSLAMFDNNTASSSIVVVSTGSTGESIPNLNTANVDVTGSDLVIALGDNIAKNGKFRENITGWSAVSGARVWDATGCLKYTSNGGAPTGIYQDIVNSLSTYVRVSFKAKSPTLTTTMRTYNVALTAVANPAMTTEWQEYIFEGNLSANSFRMYILSTTNVANEGVIYYDDIEIVQYEP